MLFEFREPRINGSEVGNIMPEGQDEGYQETRWYFTFFSASVKGPVDPGSVDAPQGFDYTERTIGQNDSSRAQD